MVKGITATTTPLGIFWGKNIMGDWVQTLREAGQRKQAALPALVDESNNPVKVPIFQDQADSDGTTNSGWQQAMMQLLDWKGSEFVGRLFQDPTFSQAFAQQYPDAGNQPYERLNNLNNQWAQKDSVNSSFQDALPLMLTLATAGLMPGGGTLGDAIPSSTAGVGADIGSSIAGNTVTAGTGAGTGAVTTGAIGSGGPMMPAAVPEVDPTFGGALTQSAPGVYQNISNSISGVPQTPSLPNSGSTAPVAPPAPAPAPTPGINPAVAATAATATGAVASQAGGTPDSSSGVTNLPTAPAPVPTGGGTGGGNFDINSIINGITGGTTDWSTLLTKYGPSLIGGLIGATQNQTAPITQTPWNSQFFGPLQNQAQTLMQNNPLNLPQVPGMQQIPDNASPEAANAYADSVVGNMNRTFTDPGGVLSSIRSDFTANQPGGGTRQSLAEGVAGGREALNQGLVRSQIMNAIYPTNLNYNAQRVQQNNANQQWQFGQDTGRTTAMWQAPWQNLSQAGNIFTGAAGKGQTTVLPNTPWWQSGLGGALATQGVVNKIGGQ